MVWVALTSSSLHTKLEISSTLCSEDLDDSDSLAISIRECSAVLVTLAGRGSSFDRCLRSVDPDYHLFSLFEGRIRHKDQLSLTAKTVEP
jgi:hypothetical protein